MTSGQNETGPSEPRALPGRPAERAVHPGLDDAARLRRRRGRPGDEPGGRGARPAHRREAALRDEVRALRPQVEGIPASRSRRASRPSHPRQRPADRGQLRRRGGGVQPPDDQRGAAPSTRRRPGRPGRTPAGSSRPPRRRPPSWPTGPIGARRAAARSVEELEEQVAYLKAFGQACRVQLRAYLEALLSDVENEWGRADPAAVQAERRLPPGAALGLRAVARAGRRSSATRQPRRRWRTGCRSCTPRRGPTRFP